SPRKTSAPSPGGGGSSQTIWSVKSPVAPLKPETRTYTVCPGDIRVATRDPSSHESSLHAIWLPEVPGHPLCSESTVSYAGGQSDTRAMQSRSEVKVYHTSGESAAWPHEAVPSLVAPIVVPATLPSVATIASAHRSLATGPGTLHTRLI